jgi:hypothetical protein
MEGPTVTGDPILLTAVALLRSRDAEITALKETLAVKAIQVRWLKHLLVEQDAEIDTKEQTISDLYADLFAEPSEFPPNGPE